MIVFKDLADHIEQFCILLFIFHSEITGQHTNPFNSCSNEESKSSSLEEIFSGVSGFLFEDFGLICLSNSNLVVKCCDGDFLMAVYLTLAFKFSLGFEPLSSDVSLGGKSKLSWELVEAASSSLTEAF